MPRQSVIGLEGSGGFHFTDGSNFQFNHRTFETIGDVYYQEPNTQSPYLIHIMRPRILVASKLTMMPAVHRRKVRQRLSGIVMAARVCVA